MNILKEIELMKSKLSDNNQVELDLFEFKTITSINSISPNTTMESIYSQVEYYQVTWRKKMNTLHPFGEWGQIFIPEYSIYQKGFDQNSWYWHFKSEKTKNYYVVDYQSFFSTVGFIVSNDGLQNELCFYDQISDRMIPINMDIHSYFTNAFQYAGYCNWQYIFSGELSINELEEKVHKLIL
ncbi:MAG: hypothetical protein MUC87_20400 [Bacteroidia bacterium]|jgi:hypothetical protein|nr:hypothetical protein [Bacteroidia bacterium]